ncbi:exodeoxyribonuclease V [Kitasatospora sp. MMS16-BH015]|uniref:ATP-binding domain-containing protein n=1 Tax=Kitasatospora sp. MMS16-BH015 TaxID=2018025 RepID=UPI000CA21E6B|nr:ATP-binding domain-containing protein [Kitasatospora sp. MMS16-BH015]AUG76253.1 exodeoxyribonuclease V [Kitasatospora sp. MMS16-BH015]
MSDTDAKAAKAAALAELTKAVRKVEQAPRPGSETRVQRKVDRIAEQEAEAAAAAEAEAVAAAKAAEEAAAAAEAGEAPDTERTADGRETVDGGEAPADDASEDAGAETDGTEDSAEAAAEVGEGPDAEAELDDLPEAEAEAEVTVAVADSVEPVEPVEPSEPETEPGSEVDGPEADEAELEVDEPAVVAAAAPVRVARVVRAAAVAVVSDEQRVAALRAVAEVLKAGGAPVELAEAAVAGLGEAAAEELRADPWAVLGLPGVRPEHADGFARGLLGAEAGPGDPRRAGALACWVLEQAALRGHSALESGELVEKLAELNLPEAAEALQTVVADGRVMAFQEELPGFQPRSESAEDEDEVPTRTLLALERLALAEESLADGLVRLASTVVPAEGAWAGAVEAAPSASAKALIEAVAGHGLVTHTGGEEAKAEPAALLRAAHRLGLRAWAATWTDQGRAALTERLGGGSAPVAVLADLLAGTAGPGLAEDTSLALDLLIVLDAPQLDVELAATLVESLADGTRLVLSGDPGQLWSAGPGRFFADLLAAKACPVVASRTPDLGPIGELVSGIGIGELLPVDAPGKEVVILPAKDGGEAVHRALQLLTDSIPRALGIPVEEVTLLTPGHGGSAGTRALNAAAKARLNPGPGRFGGFDPGDRVVHSPTPGVSHPGRVVDGDAAGLHVLLSDGTRLTLSPAEAGKLRHGWALTVHQAVGRRWPGVVVVLPEDAAAGLTRQLVYTAFGRAERHLSVVHGAGAALGQAVAGREAAPRTTRLRAVLAEG